MHSLKEPIVLYEESHSVLNATFDDCIDISGVLIPKLVQNGDGLVEFEADQLEFAFLKQLQWMPVKSVTRFGYDLENDRCYFAVGLVPNSAGARIGFGAGEVKDFTGIAAYNMTVARDEQEDASSRIRPAKSRAISGTFRCIRGANPPLRPASRGR